MAETMAVTTITGTASTAPEARWPMAAGRPGQNTPMSRQRSAPMPTTRSRIITSRPPIRMIWPMTDARGDAGSTPAFSPIRSASTATGRTTGRLAANTRNGDGPA